MADLLARLTRNEPGKQTQLVPLGQRPRPALARFRQLHFPSLTSQKKPTQLRRSRTLLFPEDHEQFQSDTLTQQ